MRMEKFKPWDVITRLKDLSTDSQLLEEIILLLRLLASIISRLTTKETFEKRIQEVSAQILEYVYPDQKQ